MLCGHCQARFGGQQAQELALEPLDATRVSGVDGAGVGLTIFAVAVQLRGSEGHFHVAQLFPVAAHGRGVVLTELGQGSGQFPGQPVTLALDTNAEGLRVFVIGLGVVQMLLVSYVNLGDNHNELLDGALAQQRQQEILVRLTIRLAGLRQEQDGVDVLDGLLGQADTETLCVVEARGVDEENAFVQDGRGRLDVDGLHQAVVRLCARGEFFELASELSHCFLCSISREFNFETEAAGLEKLALQPRQVEGLFLAVF